MKLTSELGFRLIVIDSKWFTGSLELALKALTLYTGGFNDNEMSKWVFKTPQLVLQLNKAYGFTTIDLTD